MSPVGARDLILRITTAAALGVDALVHLRLAPGYQEAAPQGVGVGNLFRAEALLAVVVAAWVLVRGDRRALGALVVGASALAAVLLYRYVDVPAWEPLPAMYEPVWFGQKITAAVAAAVAVLAALVAILSSLSTRSVMGLPR